MFKNLISTKGNLNQIFCQSSNASTHRGREFREKSLSSPEHLSSGLLRSILCLPLGLFHSQAFFFSDLKTGLKSFRLEYILEDSAAFQRDTTKRSLNYLKTKFSFRKTVLLILVI